MLENFKEEDIVEEVTQRLKLSNNNLKCKYLDDKIHKKYSVSAEKEKEYHHFFYSSYIWEIPAYNIYKQICMIMEFSVKKNIINILFIVMFGCLLCSCEDLEK